MLSPNARAFCVENLLGLSSSRESCEQTTEKRDERGYYPVAVSEAGQNIFNFSQTVYDDSGTKRITFDLLHNDLWHSFHSLGTEMIITKSGRRMFPAVRVRIRGLDPDSKYRLFMDFLQLDRNKYRYVYHSSKWMISGTGESMIPDQFYNHPDSPMDSNFLNTQIVSFERVKLTNNDRLKVGQVSLLSMQRFQPRIHVEKLCENLSGRNEHFIATFPQTSFIAVTAYQNQEITRLKIARNPFAKGFREAGKNRSSLEAMMDFYGLQIHNTEIDGRELTRKTSRKATTEGDYDRKIKRFCHDRLCEFASDLKGQTRIQHVIMTDNIYQGMPFQIKTENKLLPYCNSGLQLDSMNNIPEKCSSLDNCQHCAGSYYSKGPSLPEITVQCKQEVPVDKQYNQLSKQLQNRSPYCNYIISDQNITFSYPR